MTSANCAVCNSKKNGFIEKERTEGLLVVKN